ncbi:MAG: ferrous iron transport protein A [Planctomycetes bacterium]|nr:ferrous iron transport protein A [Planctomycetota bacterium]
MLLASLSDVRLSELARGDTALVLGFVTSDEGAIRKLLALGLAPGDEIRVLATWPAFLLELGVNSYALDRELASHVLVARRPR